MARKNALAGDSDNGDPLAPAFTENEDKLAMLLGQVGDVVDAAKARQSKRLIGPRAHRRAAVLNFILEGHPLLLATKKAGYRLTADEVAQVKQLAIAELSADDPPTQLGLALLTYKHVQKKAWEQFNETKKAIFLHIIIKAQLASDDLRKLGPKAMTFRGPVVNINATTALTDHQRRVLAAAGNGKFSLTDERRGRAAGGEELPAGVHDLHDAGVPTVVAPRGDSGGA
jgi:hypothetical protein